MTSTSKWGGKDTSCSHMCPLAVYIKGLKPGVDERSIVAAVRVILCVFLSIWVDANE